MTPARILYIELNEDGTTGGSHQALLDLVQHLDRQRFTPVVLCYQANVFLSRFRAAGAEVHAWDRERVSERAIRGPWWMPWRPLTQWRAIARRVRFLRRERIDLVHINNSPSIAYGDWLPAARLAGVACISHVRGELARPTLPARMLVPRFDRLVAISDSIERHVRSAVPGARVTRVYDGIDAAAVRARAHTPSAKVRAGIGVPDDALLVFMAGHLRRWKGQHIVLDAFRELPAHLRSRCHLAFAGAPDRFAPEYSRSLHATAADPSLEGRVHFLGARDDVPDLMVAADVVVHASTVAEPFGLVVLEAMALGRPVIASSLGGPSEIVVPGAGWTFDPCVPTALRTCLRAVLEDTGARRQASVRARARADAFSIEQTVDGVVRIYETLLDLPPAEAYARGLGAAVRVGEPSLAP